MNLDQALINYGEKRKKLAARIKQLKVIGINQGNVADMLNKSPSAISDLFTSGKDRYKWDLEEIEKALKTLEVYDD